MRAGLPILLGIALANMSIKIGTAAAAQGLIALHGLPIEIVQWPAFAICLWFLWRIVSQGALPASDGRARGSAALRLANGFAFQLTNPKAWITGWAAATLFAAPATGAPPNPLVFGLIALPSVVLGAGAFLILGAALRRLAGRQAHPARPQPVRRRTDGARHRPPSRRLKSKETRPCCRRFPRIPTFRTRTRRTLASPFRKPRASFSECRI